MLHMQNFAFFIFIWSFLFLFVNMILFSLTGDLLVTLARKSDTGLYTCEVINEEGVDMASSFVSVLGKLLCIQIAVAN